MVTACPCIPAKLLSQPAMKKKAAMPALKCQYCGEKVVGPGARSKLEAHEQAHDVPQEWPEPPDALITVDPQVC